MLELAQVHLKKTAIKRKQLEVVVSVECICSGWMCVTFQPMSHHWVEGNCAGKCDRCSKSIKAYNRVTGRRCRWCKLLVSCTRITLSQLPPLPLLVGYRFHSICLFVWQLDNSKSCRYVFVKFGEEVDHGPEKSWLNFGNDLEYGLDILSQLQIVHWLIDVKSESEVGKTSYDAWWENSGRCTCCLLVTTLCQFQCGMAEVCAVLGTIQSKSVFCFPQWMSAMLQTFRHFRV